MTAQTARQRPNGRGAAYTPRHARSGRQSGTQRLTRYARRMSVGGGSDVAHTARTGALVGLVYGVAYALVGLVRHAWPSPPREMRPPTSAASGTVALIRERMHDQADALPWWRWRERRELRDRADRIGAMPEPLVTTSAALAILGELASEARGESDA